MSMTYSDPTTLRALIDRLARLASADDWKSGLNPAQVAVLSYLARANRFSRAPSHAAAFLGTTRGTVSQTFKSLLGKGLVQEYRSASDRRRISFDLSEAGRGALMRLATFDEALLAIDNADRAALEQGISALLRALVAARGGRPFGICHTCRYHAVTNEGRQCRLLNVALKPAEADQICHEYSAKDAA